MKRTRAAMEYEFRTVRFTRDTPRGEAKQALTEAAEYGRWELARTRIGMGGVRTHWLRRRIVRVERTA
ncbi:hypothetical protein GSY69_02860 [Brevibacterium sp. 5221]|uniref:Uncharacterized protein n=1 Tax=Brevibacterium rongguiense TaxID=2695267 RepID=A0A6N9H578_9MICO|nr:MULTISPECIES: DUF5703 family protein [Brevibacterium]MYM18946.1 hypothetical protein [Brevibacterium rongguiense]WAL40794.1 DUF5703 family protein [Brevibacterium sp. BRM-1]